MPELPEVETIRLGLEKYLVGCKIIDVEIKIPRMLAGSAKQIIGAKIIGLKRIGKGLIIELDNDFVLAIHLKMTGQLIYQDSRIKGPTLSPKIGGPTLPTKYSHIIFTLDNGSFLYYNDLRQFGWVKVVRKDELMQIPFFKEMGPEPPVAKAMGGQAPLNLSKFIEILGKSNTAIKVLIMDQKKIGGIGNIYANEAYVLKKSLEYGGSSDENFVNALGQEGNYQKHALVYGREGEKCPDCNSRVQKIKLGGRGTYFCPKCQK